MMAQNKFPKFQHVDTAKYETLSRSLWRFLEGMPYKYPLNLFIMVRKLFEVHNKLVNMFVSHR